jgi:hypothetical protein
VLGGRACEILRRLVARGAVVRLGHDVRHGGGVGLRGGLAPRVELGHGEVFGLGGALRLGAHRLARGLCALGARELRTAGFAQRLVLLARHLIGVCPVAALELEVLTDGVVEQSHASP